MSENELFEHRIKTLENDVKILYGKVNTFAINQAEENTKLDNLLLSVGELKESISEMDFGALDRLTDDLIKEMLG